MPYVVHLVVCARRAGELIPTEKIQPRRRIRINPRPQLVYAVKRRKERRRDVGKIVNIALVLHDRILQCPQDTALRDIADTARFLNAQRIVVDAIAYVVDRRAHLDGEVAVALDECHAVRDDGVLAVCLLIDIDIRDLRELVHEEIALVTQVVRLAAVILGEHDVLVEDSDLFRDTVCLADLNAHFIVLRLDLILQLTCTRLDAVDEVVALRQYRCTRR